MADDTQIALLKRNPDEWISFVSEQRMESEWRPNLTGADLRGVNLRNAYLSGADLRDADLSGADLHGANLYKADPIRADLSGADLSDAHLGDTNFRGANLIRARLSGAYLSDANLSDADLTGANLTSADLTKAILTNALLTRANLRDADLRGADLSDADLSDANLSEANLSDATLHGAILIRAKLVDTNLTRVDLDYADLRSADLVRAIFTRAKLRSANFAEARLSSTLLPHIDLASANGLLTLVHEGPSAIDTGTLIRSRGKIPDSFLRNCGLNEWEVQAARLYDPDLASDQYVDIAYRIAELRTTGPIQPNPVFISYTHSDGAFVDTLQAGLEKKGIRSWRDISNAEAGPTDKVIDRAISLNPTMIVVLSEASVESEWVRWEVKRAIELEKELDRPVLCPIALDEDWKKCRWPYWLRERIEEYTVLDYSADSAVEEMMPRLLKGLRIHYRNKATAE